MNMELVRLAPASLVCHWVNHVVLHALAVPLPIKPIEVNTSL